MVIRIVVECRACEISTMHMLKGTKLSETSFSEDTVVQSISISEPGKVGNLQPCLRDSGSDQEQI